jgi:DNA-binding CsgD family transcriptional regulator
MTWLFPYAGYDGPKRKPPKRKPPPPPPRKKLPRPVERPLLNFSGISNMPPSLRAIMLEVCEEHNVVPADIAGHDSRQHVVQARRVYCIMARARSKYSYTSIGRSINKDHTTVIHYVKQGQAGHSLAPVEQTTTPPKPRAVRQPVTELSPLQQTYANLADQGLEKAQIAERMGKSLAAVSHYEKHVRRKRAQQSREAQGTAQAPERGTQEAHVDRP